mmetsp:Transcript_58931/g.105092  ORF Transcript_58931/g.105092 Transcript_58931/m.105092 type:complete len:219 (-) Transcript_58931:1044-1700(-)
MVSALHRVLGVLPRVLGVLHRVQGVLHMVLGVLHRVLGVLHRVHGGAFFAALCLRWHDLTWPQRTSPAWCTQCGARFPHPRAPTPPGTHLPGTLAPLVPTSLGINPVGLSTKEGRYTQGQARALGRVWCGGRGRAAFSQSHLAGAEQGTELFAPPHTQCAEDSDNSGTISCPFGGVQQHKGGAVDLAPSWAYFGSPALARHSRRHDVPLVTNPPPYKD